MQNISLKNKEILGYSPVKPPEQLPNKNKNFSLFP